MKNTQPTLKELEGNHVSPRKTMAMPEKAPVRVAATSITKRKGMPTPMKGSK